jgi:shikimate dehydrogenase
VSPPRRAGVLGHPIDHSLSPVLHRAAYRALGLDWAYDAHDVTADGLEAFLAGLDDSWVGLSLTMPLKVEAVRLVDFLEPLAKAVGVANTVLLQPRAAGGQRIGANTDVPGIIAALREAGVGDVGSAVILGAGATATSAVAAVASMGCSEPVVVARERSRAGALWRASTRLGATPRVIGFDGVGPELAVADVVVSTIPAAAGASVARDAALRKVRGALLDAVYDPVDTPLARAWRDAGGTAVDGTRMLLHQAAEQVRLFTGKTAPIAEMRSALVSHLSH